MPILLFKLRGVPEDEAEEVRAWLEKNKIDFYETDGGNWGISMAAIWLRDDAQLSQAKVLLDSYQSERAVRMRRQYAEAKKEGRGRRLLDSIVENPLRIIICLAIILLVIYLSMAPFLNMSKWL